ncbi:nuclear prelamin A recognition factor-like protein [Endogone sp. FLAS-F59071]|nr:nuclear prelamin A recognition factor-like protein [Endogone sp. FLAS-F59071]|eukprot:RUS16273.1 nuclear prelamin A recognition factor-like protein [Endogone sp. FLAS-F59071]
MAFSGAVVLADLNDFISPSQACIKPVEVKTTRKDNDSQTSIKIDDTGGYYEVTQDGEETRLEKASITLNDCLACSGCITSAESVLVAQQSNEELYNILKNNQMALINNTPETHRTIVVSVSPQSRASLAVKYNLTPLQIARRLTYFLKRLGAHHVFDTSVSRDFSLVESAREFVERYCQNQANQPVAEAVEQKPRRRTGRDETSAARSTDLPMLASSCPGWICYAEKTHGYVLPHISVVKSPQQVMGSIVKEYLAGKWSVKYGGDFVLLGRGRWGAVVMLRKFQVSSRLTLFILDVNCRPNQIYHVCVMPCYDKKLEASRPDFYDEAYATRDVDCVITTGEIDKMLEQQGTDLRTLPEDELDSV